ncbi:hypothetical protein [Rhizobium sp. MHM7A]|uniref:hypothetical protein n=1 Tax=Rhizobium sp. MHM7A TaxID=2583233 RepID=UPI001106FB4F|nr:hypothetical protein [Rhizobium sp. MHM7A]TLX16460.1 hypothetical protein FFR93_03750 [Rhizobium sp. MHM7A]
MLFNRLMACLHQIDASLIAGSTHARLYLYKMLGVSPKLHRVVPFSLAWAATLVLAVFTGAEVWGWRPEFLIVIGQIAVLAASGWIMYRLYKSTAPHRWEKHDYQDEMAKAVFYRTKQDIRTASVVVLTSTSINVLIIKSMGLMTLITALTFATLLVWALAMVMVLHIVSADPPPPESGDMKMVPQGA